MKQLFTLLFICALGLSLHAQAPYELYARTDYSLWFSRSKSIGGFLSSYNSYQAAHPESGGVKQFKENVGAMNGIIYGVGLRFFLGNGYIDGSVNGSKFSSGTNSFIYDNGDAREIKVTSRDFIFQFGFGFGKKLCFGPDFNITVQNTAVAAGFRYADGTLTYSNTQGLNGVYSTTRIGLYYGLEASYRLIKYVRFTFGFGRYGALLPIDKFEFNDNSGSKGLDAQSNYYLPQDFGLYAADPNTGSDNSAYNNLRGLRLNFGIRLLIPSGIDEKK